VGSLTKVVSPPKESESEWLSEHRRRCCGCLSCSWVQFEVLLISDLRAYWVVALPPWFPCFQRTYAVFIRYRPPFSCEIGFILP
jgi:hypothetical protein